MVVHRRVRLAALALVLTLTTAIGPAAGEMHSATVGEAELAALWDKASAAGALGMYREDDGEVVVVMSATSDAAFTTADAREIVASAEVQLRDIDAATIDAIFTQLRHRGWADAPQSAAYGVYFDAKSGRVVIEGEAAQSQFEGLLAQWRNDAVYRQVDYAGRLSRRNELQPIDGGAAAFDGDTVLPRCTTGFKISVGGKSRMVTAGHCFDLNELVWSQDSGISFGTVVSKALFPAQDMEILGGANYIARQYVGDQVGVLEQVTGVGEPQVGVTYCFSGWVSAERCGNSVTNLFGMFCDPGCTINLAVFQAPVAPQGGDSGAPFYRATGSTNSVRGILVARTGNTGYAHKWSTIRDWWGATWP